MTLGGGAGSFSLPHGEGAASGDPFSAYAAAAAARGDSSEAEAAANAAMAAGMTFGSTHRICGQENGVPVPALRLPVGLAERFRLELQRLNRLMFAQHATASHVRARVVRQAAQRQRRAEKERERAARHAARQRRRREKERRRREKEGKAAPAADERAAEEAAAAAAAAAEQEAAAAAAAAAAADALDAEGADSALLVLCDHLPLLGSFQVLDAVCAISHAKARAFPTECGSGG